MSLFDFSKRLDDRVRSAIPGGYFVKRIFQVALLLFVLIGCLALWQAPSFSGTYVECPANARSPCLNPLYEQGCLSFPCGLEVLQPGTVYGVKPSWVVRNAEGLVWLVGVGAFVLNHVLWTRRKEHGIN